MQYTSMEELNKSYKDRSLLSFEEELSYVEDCFDTLEGLGFKNKFDSPYQKGRERHNGKKFVVTGRLSYANGDADLECLPMWRIQFEDGAMLDAYPEEICNP